MTKNRLNPARHRRHHRTHRAAGNLAAELAGYTTRAELLELSAVLARHTDADADPVRALVDWTRAA